MLKNILTFYYGKDRLYLVLLYFFKFGIIKVRKDDLTGYSIVIAVHKIEACFSLSYNIGQKIAYEDIAKA